MKSKLLAKLPKWNTPTEGKSLTLKEWLIYSVGGCGAMGATAFIQFYTLAYGVYIAAALNMSTMHIMYVGYATSIITILTSPLMSWLIDNTNTKWGKFRPYLIVLPVPILVCFIALGQISAITNYTVMIILYTIVFNIAYFFNRIYTFAFSSLVQVISPNPDERTQVMSIGTFFTSLGPTLVSMIYPAVANYLYTEDKISGVNSLMATKVVAPIMLAVFFALGLVCAFGVRERVVLPKKYKQKQKFMDGVRKSVTNKYFWISNISSVLGVFGIVATSFTLWIILYMIFPSLKENGKADAAYFVQTIITTLVGDACVPGMLLAPWLIKKMGKRNLLIASNALTVVATIPMIFIKNPIALLVMIYLVTFFNGFTIVVSPAIRAEIYDYQQYKSGDRLEGFLSQFGTMIITAFGLLTALVQPAVYKKFGYIDSTDVLYDNKVLLGIISAMCLIGVISGILSILPYLFYDLKPNFHKKIMQVLTVRAKCEDGLCDEETRDSLIARIENGEENVLDYFKDIDGDAQSEGGDSSLDEGAEDNLSISGASAQGGADDIADDIAAQDSAEGGEVHMDVEAAAKDVPYTSVESAGGIAKPIAEAVEAADNLDATEDNAKE